MTVNIKIETYFAQSVYISSNLGDPSVFMVLNWKKNKHKQM